MAHATRDETTQAALSAAETLFKLWRTHFLAEMKGKVRLASQLAVLCMIGLHGPLSSRRLGELLLITPGAVTQMVDVLVNAGLVQRQVYPDDRRVINLSLTPEGRAKFAEISAKRRALLQEVFRDLTDDELATYRSVQTKMIAKLQALRHTDTSHKEQI